MQIEDPNTVYSAQFKEFSTKRKLNHYNNQSVIQVALFLV